MNKELLTKDLKSLEKFKNNIKTPEYLDKLAKQISKLKKEIENCKE